ncbi:hypothetical protein GLOIN_2v1835075 [Rhizophagus irregularis DAOM 181602=DAOM 197198]|uniref:Serine-threonine/tyrosine-protein kinase catalytic domain-containing protein n=1 Tax=Rhizophagus irregularis (strain DAOM 181602 / DAOM 197198 / MUCL 43194) TaxID=747089 RepID=A0A2P4QUZ0_RHIID|nr:hypothetical protein GLOIN_2v1835075 [Rhizophagus irregularis DAOM 181602=DAOM 197198]POG81459.1 hypothetical protein GLOIN_2v1835075 [Rhizophagus irregularis DAOM 181602=DAOM 197198]|eukprot:XP_025188325.1 hypothetical protein GLOIN_2v1835075 [Rhizophagus irregularis DAOM 181602=DAOM 197198]
MKECWHSDPEKRPHATDIYDKIDKMKDEEWKNSCNKNPTEIVKSSDIGPVTTNNPNAIYKSRNLSGMISTAMSLRSLRSHQSINLGNIAGKRKYENDLIEDKNDSDYLSEEIKFDIDINFNNNGYYEIFRVPAFK